MMTMDTINSSRGWLLEATVLLWNIIIDYIDFAMSKSREMLYVQCDVLYIRNSMKSREIGRFEIQRFDDGVVNCFYMARACSM